jgi:hypothetical protein
MWHYQAACHTFPQHVFLWVLVAALLHSMLQSVTSASSGFSLTGDVHVLAAQLPWPAVWHPHLIKVQPLSCCKHSLLPCGCKLLLLLQY